MKFLRLLSSFSLSFVVLAIGILGFSSASVSAELTAADGSPLAGISFDDQPLLLPVQRNFQMSILTASSELGRSCGAMEAYGWRFSASEQERVDLVFNATVDKMRAQGYAVESRSSPSVAPDVTIFTADRQDKNLLFMWSAGDVGLVMIVCETSAPVGGRLGRIEAQNLSNPKTMKPAPSARQGSLAGGPLLSGAGAPASGTRFSAVQALHDAMASRETHHDVGDPTVTNAYRSLAVPPITKDKTQRILSPVGDWHGDYTCGQGTTGGTLSITKLKGDRFEGVFKFYPTRNNPSVQSGSYEVYGDYDAATQRILINPGRWIQRPSNYYNTIMIGSFRADTLTFSGFFQGITGCTSFEAHYAPNASSVNDDRAPLHRGAVEAKKEKPRKVSKSAKPKAKKAKTLDVLPAADSVIVPPDSLSALPVEAPKADSAPVIMPPLVEEAKQPVPAVAPAVEAPAPTPAAEKPEAKAVVDEPIVPPPSLPAPSLPVPSSPAPAQPTAADLPAITK